MKDRGSAPDFAFSVTLLTDLSPPGWNPYGVSLPRAQPSRIEIAVGFAVIGQARHVPMAHEPRIGGPDLGAAADEDDPAGKAREHRFRACRRADLDHGALRQRPGGKGVRGPRPGMITWPRVISKKRSTSSMNSRPRLPSQGIWPLSPSCPRLPMAQMTRMSAMEFAPPCAKEGQGGS